jgi:hypothetical protein
MRPTSTTTLHDLHERYVAEHLPGKAPRAAADDRSMWTTYILPAFGGTSPGRERRSRPGAADDRSMWTTYILPAFGGTSPGRERRSRPGGRPRSSGGRARGRAVDIMRFRRSDGSYVNVLDGWPSPEHGDLLREVHEGACGIFSTTIGPESDAFHEEHFHYDVAERQRPYCP